MTATFRTLLDDLADTADLGHPDPADLARRGRVRVRRRRTAAAVGATGLAATVALGAVWLGGDDGRRTAVDPASTGLDLPLGALTWTSGSELRTSRSSTDLGHLVNAYVVTTAGYVTVDPGGVVRSVTRDGVATVGRTTADIPRLVSDQDGTLAGWVDADGARPAFVVLDQADGSVVRDDRHTTPGMGVLADEADPAYFYAIDDGQAYWRDDRGLVEVDVASGDVAVLDADARNGLDVAAAEGGLLAAVDAESRGVVVPVGSDPTTGVVLEGYSSGTAVFSPDGRWLSLDADEPQVFDTATGTEVDLGLDVAFATGYQWLDDSTLAVISQARSGRDASPPELLACDVVVVACTGVSELPPFGELVGEPGRFALPTGVSTAN